MRSNLSVPIRVPAFAWLLFALWCLISLPASSLAAPGDLDTLNAVVDGDLVYASVVQPDGRIILAGGFTSVLGVPRSGIARLNMDGSLDMGFDPKVGGVALPSVLAVVVQADGKIVLGGDFTTLQPSGSPTPVPSEYIARLNPDGTLDFNYQPKAQSAVRTVAIQPDGKLLFGGLFTSIRSTGAPSFTPINRIARVNLDGTLDAGFNPNANDAVLDIEVQPDGKILLAGNFVSLQPNGSPSPTTRNRIARVNSDGTLDINFDPAANLEVKAVALQADGRILIGGAFTTVQPAGSPAPIPRSSIARLNANGSLDFTFDPNPGTGAPTQVASLAVQADGKIILGGSFTTLQPNGAPASSQVPNVARVDTSGALDTSFLPRPNGGVAGVALQTNGKVLLAGAFTSLQPNTAPAATPRKLFARLQNDPAVQGVARVSATRIQWNRSGAAPEIEQVTFEYSTDSVNFSLLGAGGRVAGGWELSGPALPAAGWFRARGRTTAGTFNASSGLIEQVLGVTVPPSVVTGTAISTTSTGATLNATINPNGSATTARFLYGKSPDLNGATLTSPVNIGSGSLDQSFTITVGSLDPASQYYFRAVATNAFGTTTGDISAFATLGPLPDPAFNSAPDAIVRSTAVQRDGSTIIAGDFANVSLTPHNNIARLLPNGSLDPTFNPNADGSVRAVAVQPDDSILIGGAFVNVGGAPHSHIARLRPDGSPDAAFQTTVDGTVRALALQSDGKILIVGDFITVNDLPQPFLARLNANGSLDGTFAPTFDFAVSTVAVQSDGLIVVGGFFFNVNSTSRRYLARLNPNGTLDAGFVVSPGIISDLVQVVKVLPTGKILIGGDFTDIGGVTSNHIARLNSDGSLDTGFIVGTDAAVTTIATLADGRTLIGGGFTIVNGVMRRGMAQLFLDSRVDPQFNPDLAGGAVASISVQGDGKIVAAGAFTTVAGVPAPFLARLENGAVFQEITALSSSTVRWVRGDGSPEVEQVTFAFSPDGTNFTPLGAAARIGGNWELTGLTLPQTGTLRAQGIATSGNGNGSSGIVANEAPFDFLPIAETFPATAITASSAMLQGGVTPRGQVTMAHFEYGTDLALAGASVTVDVNMGSGVDPVPLSQQITPLLLSTRYYYRAVATNASGTTRGAILSFVTLGPLPDTGFAPAPDGVVECTVTQPDGRIVIGGAFQSVGGVARNRIARLNSDGSIDPNFNPNADGEVFAAAAQPDGKIIVAGAFNNVGGQSHVSLARLNPDGTLDPNFSPTVNVGVVALALQPDGKILIGGAFSMVNGVAQLSIARLNPDGTSDAGFAPLLDSAVTSIAVLPDGNILIAGDFTQVNGGIRSYLARLTSSGAVDSAFNPILSGSVYAQVVQPDGRIVIAGNFSSVNGVRHVSIARLNAIGTLDPLFDTDIPGTIYSLVLTADGRIVVGGIFEEAGLEPRGNLARFNPDGTLDQFFNPGVTGNVFSLETQADGKLLVGGALTAVAGLPHMNLTRIDMGPGVQAITVSPSTVRWIRGGPTPEVEQVTFELSTDGTTWMPFDIPSRIAGGWQSTAVVLPPVGFIRAQGRAVGGQQNGSSSILESVQGFNLALPVIGAVFADGVTPASATLHASINPSSQATTGYFEYGTDPALAGASTTLEVSLGAGSSPVPLDQIVGSLALNTQYYYRAVATNTSGTIRSAILSFSTGGNLPVVITSPDATVFTQPGGNIVVNIGATFLSDQPVTGVIQVSLDPGFDTIEYENNLGLVSGDVAIGIGSPTTYIFAAATTYYYRAIGTNASGTTIGAVLSFITPGVPPPILDDTDPVPNEPPGTTFVEFGTPTVDGGIIGGIATITTPDGKSQTIIFGGPNGAVLARTGVIAPNGAIFIELGDPVFGGEAFGFAARSRPALQGAPFFSNASPLLLSTGRSLAAAPNAAGGKIVSGLWSQRSFATGLEQIAFQGGSAPGVETGKFAKLSGFGLPRGRAGLVFLGKLGIGPGVKKGTENGIWRERPTGGTDLLLRDGNPIDMPGGGIRSLRRALFMKAVPQAPDQRRGFATDGGVAASATFTDGSAGIVLVAPDGTTDIPVDTATPVPELSGASFESFNAPATASAGRYAFLARLKPGSGGVTTKNDQQIFASGASGGLRSVLRRGATLPGLGSAIVNRLGEPLMGEGGLIGLVAAVKGTGVSAKNREAIVIHSAGKSTVAARLGEQAHGLGDGVFYQRFLSVVVTDAPQSRLVFTATLTGPGITKRNRQGLWSVTPSGSVRLLLRLGDNIMVGDETPTVTLFDALNPKSANRGQGRSTDASGFLTARVKLSNFRTGILRIPVP